MKKPFTAATRPIFSCGVNIWMSVERSTTDTLSSAPPTARIASDSTNERERPNAIQEMPKNATAQSSARPARRKCPNRATQSDMAMEPTAGPARRKPNPTSPTPSTSRAKTGRSAVAPPKSTANMSRLIAPSRSCWWNTKRTPSTISGKNRPPGAGNLGRAAMLPTAARPQAKSAITTAYAARGPPSAMRAPPAAGPSTVATWNTVERQAAAFW